VPRTLIAVTALLLAVLAGACGSNSGDDRAASTSTSRADAATSVPSVGGRTDLSVTGVRTKAGAEPSAPPTEVPFSGTLRCDGTPSGTGTFAATAAGTCAEVVTHRDALTAKSDPAGRICSQIYGGPQHATVTGTVDGEPVSLEVTRSNGCGIADWTRLEWLLGPPEQ
jgi:Subtilisin inhibitor-like